MWYNMIWYDMSRSTIAILNLGLFGIIWYDMVWYEMSTATTMKNAELLAQKMSMQNGSCADVSPLILGVTDTLLSKPPPCPSSMTVEPSLMLNLIPFTATSATGVLGHTKDRQALVPDIHIIFPSEYGPESGRLAEIKFLSVRATWYQSKLKTVV